MRRPIHLQIPAPCQEAWDGMFPTDGGRHCAACRKTVIDFTGLTDSEVLATLARAGQGVCGRFDGDQLRRPLSLPQPPSGKRWKAWPVIVAGIFASLRLSAQTRPARAHTLQAALRKTTIALQPVGTGPAGFSFSASRPPLIHMLLMVDSFKTLPVVEVRSDPWMTRTMTTGMILTQQCVESTKKRDTVWKQVTDTLVAWKLLPYKEWNIYPNPIPRGGTLSLVWQSDPGEYQVRLYDAAGRPVLERLLQVSARQQVDLLTVPASCSAGVYVLEATRKGRKSLTQKLVMR